MSAQLQFAIWVSALQTLTFLTLWGAYTLMFRAGIARRFQVGGGKPPAPELARAGVLDAAIGNLTFPFACYAAVYPLWIGMGGRMTAEWPAAWVVVAHLLVFIAAEDTIFYWSHRALHTRWLFSKVHYRHHRFRMVRGPSAYFAHPLEALMNFVAMFAGPVALGSPFPVVALWIVVRIAETIDAHSGYALTPVASRHAFHHLHAQRGCYGSFLSPWDFLLGTDRMWRESKATGRSG